MGYQNDIRALRDSIQEISSGGKKKILPRARTNTYDLEKGQRLKIVNAQDRQIIVDVESGEVTIQYGKATQVLEDDGVHKVSTGFTIIASIASKVKIIYL